MFKRFRRLRMHGALREMVKESRVHRKDLIYPLFIKEGIDEAMPVPSLPGISQLSIKAAKEEIKEARVLGIGAIMLFFIPLLKDSVGSAALDSGGFVADAIRELKKDAGDVALIADLCFCEYTDHGHCGIIEPKSQSVANDLTLEILGKQAVVLAEAGIDMVAPSGMMDGMIAHIRDALDKAGHYNLPIMSYSTKFASSFYGPFRDVAESTPGFGDRRSYQEDFCNGDEALNESLEDERQGADILMVKPGLLYLDVLRSIKEQSLLPLAVYNVSGEYAMLKAAAKAGAIDYERALMEMMTGFKRAGADIIITYHAKEVCTLLQQQER